ncbi:MAG: HAMP domain-containing sensor histidine kinase [Acidimicrobiales bacterium]
MSLRARLIVAYLAVVVVLGTALVVVARVQHDHLVDQLDRQLTAVRPFVQPGRFSPSDMPQPGTGQGTGQGNGQGGGQGGDAGGGQTSDRPQPTDGPISDLFIGYLDDTGALVPVLTGVLLDDEPEIDADVAADLPADGSRVFVTVPGTDGDSEFRVTVQNGFDGTPLVVALPLDEVNDAVRRLVLALSIAAALVLLAMALTMWWVFRLGLRPVARMTEAATEIAAGRRDRRVEDTDPATEVGRLGRALNDMLDERDRNEDKLRQFVADASHELRTPLTSIRGGLDLAIDDALPAERRHEVLRRVRGESRRMHDLVEDLLLLASLDSGRPLRSEPVDLVSVVHDAAADARALQPDRPVSVVPEAVEGGPSPSPSIVVDGDEMRLRQVVAGLVHNALHHTPVDAALRISVQRDTAGVVLAVADRGPGLDPEHASTVFDRFTRGDGARSRHAGGAGLGLSIARSVVEAHGGTLELVTAPGEGCTFLIRLRDAGAPAPVRAAR